MVHLSLELCWLIATSYGPILFCLKLTALLKFVLMIPGAIQLTRMPSDPNSFAKTFVKAKRAVLLIEYTPSAYKTAHNVQSHTIFESLVKLQFAHPTGFLHV